MRIRTDATVMHFFFSSFLLFFQLRYCIKRVTSILNMYNPPIHHGSSIMDLFSDNDYGRGTFRLRARFPL